MNLVEAKAQLRATKPLDMLGKVARFNAGRGRSESLVSVRVVLASGYCLDGIPTDVDAIGQAVLLLHDGDVAYLDTTTVVAVQVQNPGQFMGLITDGNYFQPPADKTPSLLALKRSFLGAQERFNGEWGIALKCELLDGTMTDRAKYGLGQFLESLALTLTKIGADSEGEAALATLEEIVILASGQSDFEVERTPKGLAFQLDLERDLKTHLATLQAAIEKHI